MWASAKFPQCLENTGLEQRKHVVEFGEIVLHWRRRQQQQEALVQLIHQLVALACAVAQMVSFVHDDQVEVARTQAGGVFAPPRQRQRRDQPLLVPEAFGIGAQSRIMSRGANNVELGLEFLPPLADERRGRQNEHVLDHVSQQIFLENHAGFDGLAEPDLIGEQHPAAKLLEHLAYRLDLVPKSLDAAQMR